MKIQYQISDRVTWVREHRGGYGYIESIPAVVRKVGSKRITIAALTLHGEIVERTVSPEKLRPRISLEGIDRK